FFCSAARWAKASSMRPIEPLLSSRSVRRCRSWWQEPTKERFEVLVAASGEAERDRCGSIEIACDLRSDRPDPRKRVRGLERRKNSFGARHEGRRGKRLVVRGREVARASGRHEPRMLRTDAGVVEPCADRMGLLDLAAVVAEDVALRSMEDADAPRGQRR